MIRVWRDLLGRSYLDLLLLHKPVKAVQWEVFVVHIWTHQILLHPKNGSCSFGIFSSICFPSSARFVSIGISKGCTVVIIKKPPVLTCHALVIIIVEDVSTTGSPSIQKQADPQVWCSKCVCSKNGHCFSTIKCKIIFKKLNSPDTNTNRIRMSFIFVCFVWEIRVTSFAINRSEIGMSSQVGFYNLDPNRECRSAAKLCYP